MKSKKVTIFHEGLNMNELAAILNQVKQVMEPMVNSDYDVFHRTISHDSITIEIKTIKQMKKSHG